MASDMLQLRLSGSGGQGLILLGIILAEAAVLDGKHTVQSQSYGPEARGGASKAEVIISNGVIHFPKVVEADLLLAMTQEAVNKYVADLKPGGILIVDSRFVTEVPEGLAKVYNLPITATAVRELGKTLSANIVALGVVAELIGLNRESVIKALLGRVPAGTEEVNRKAFDLGGGLLG